MRLPFSFRKSFKVGRSSPEQDEVLAQLERAEITQEEAEARLGGTVREWQVRIGDDPAEPPERQAKEPEPPPEDLSDDELASLPEEERSRRSIEQISRDVDAESDG